MHMRKTRFVSDFNEISELRKKIIEKEKQGKENFSDVDYCALPQLRFGLRFGFRFRLRFRFRFRFSF